MTIRGVSDREEWKYGIMTVIVLSQIVTNALGDIVVRCRRRMCGFRDRTQSLPIVCRQKGGECTEDEMDKEGFWLGRENEKSIVKVEKGSWGRQELS